VEVLAQGYMTVEGPTLGADGSLYFSDVRGGGVHRLTTSGDVELVVPKRRGVGGICGHADGGIVVSGRDLTHVRDGSNRVIFERDDVAPREGTTVGGFNDIGADGRGRIVAGVQRLTPDGGYGAGDVLVVTGEHTAVTALTGVLPNGNAVSPDGSVVHQVDSVGRRILTLDLTGDQPVVVAEMSTAAVPGSPDGMAVDADGALWVAFHHGGCVVRFAPDGAELERIAVPTPGVTSVCFAAPPSTLLYVVTDSEDQAGPATGAILRVDVGVPGAPVPPATI
jgi:gluconolactonase